MNTHSFEFKANDDDTVTLTVTFPKTIEYVASKVTRRIDVPRWAEAIVSAGNGNEFVLSQFTRGWKDRVEDAGAMTKGTPRDERLAAMKAKHDAFMKGVDDGRAARIPPVLAEMREIAVKNFGGKLSDYNQESVILARCLDKALGRAMKEGNVKPNNQSAITKLRESEDVQKEARATFDRIKDTAESIVELKSGITV